MTWTDLARIYQGWSIRAVNRYEDDVSIHLSHEPASLTWPWLIQQGERWGAIAKFQGGSNGKGTQTLYITLEKKP